ncbi:FAD-dependent monooxygenase [Streptomyces nitrosporeus]|nr:FAD-dependent monooxygenase [Streptomyces nitrosporeus]GGY87848.1 3-(3-hydroxyphenyl)propionate hydroxylase [Streptomyces nitrosporeus]
MPEQSESEVIIVGAGPVGLALGVDLLRRGTDVRIIDRDPAHHPHSKSLALWPRALEGFRRLGLIEPLLERSLTVGALKYYLGERVIRVGFGSLQGSRYRYPVTLPQSATEEVLRQGFEDAGGKVEYGTELTGFTQDADGVRAVLSVGGHEAEARSQYLVGCDGAHSTVRQCLGVTFEGAAYPQRFLVADGVWETSLAQNETHYFMSPSGVLVVTSLPGGKARVFLGLGEEVPADQLADTAQRFAQARCTVPIRAVGELQTGIFRVHRRMADRFRVGRVLIAGDAAHIHSPAGAQGLNTGLEDAGALAWRLAGIRKGELTPGTLDEWERERRHTAASVVADSDRQTRMWTLGGWRSALRDVALEAADRTGALDRFVAPRQAQLALAYPGDGSRAGKLRSGMRLPDVPLEGRADQAWLHDKVALDAPVLLLFAADNRTPERLESTREGAQRLLGRGGYGKAVLLSARIPESFERERTAEIADPGGDIHRLFGIRKPTAVVVRPDATIGAVFELKGSTPSR